MLLEAEREALREETLRRIEPRDLRAYCGEVLGLPHEELARGHIEDIAGMPVAIVAAVGDHMRGTPGIASGVFGALSAAGLNVIAISQGSSERNISLVVTEDDAPAAARAIHQAFRLGQPSQG